MVTEPMTVPEPGSPDTPTKGTQRRWRWSWLVILSAVALLVVAGVAVVMTGDDDDAVFSADDDDAVFSADVAAAIAVVTAHTEAQNAADGAMMRATLTDDATWLDNGASMTLEEYVGVVEGYRPGIEQTFTGDPTVVGDPTGSGDLQVSVPMNFDSGQRSWNSISVYTLRKVDGEWKIAQVNR
jgi:hypothetical protein